jgi:hypothetical protein
MTMHSLTKSAIFFTVGHIAQVKGTQKIADMGGLTVTHPVLGWGWSLGVVAIAGLPPFGIFMSEFLVVSSTFARAPLLAMCWCSACWSLRRAVPAAARASRSASRAAAGAAGAGLLRADVRPSRARAVAGIYCRRRWSPGSRTSRRTLGASRSELAAGHATLLGLWGDAGVLFGAHGVLDRAGRQRHRGRQPRMSGRNVSLGRRAAPAGDPARARHPRACTASSRSARRTRGRGSISASGTCASARRAHAGARCAPAYAFLPAEGESLHQIPVGPVHAGIIEPGHFRFTAGGETVVRLEQRLGYVHKGIESLMAGADRTRRAARRRAPRATARSPMASPSRAPSRRRWASRRRRARYGCAR